MPLGRRRSYSAFVHSKLARLLGASSALLEVDLKAAGLGMRGARRRGLTTEARDIAGFRGLGGVLEFVAWCFGSGGVSSRAL